jgi:hypothetical protein
VTDDLVENGFKTLCNAYKRKLHMQIYPVVTKVLLNEKNAEVEEDQKGQLVTNTPSDIFKIFNDAFELILAKKIKEL